jgi:subtilisin family serine protease
VNEPEASAPPIQGLPQETTGSYLVAFGDEDLNAGVQALTRATSVKLESAEQRPQGVFSPDELAEADGLLFESLGVAVVSADPETLAVAAAEEDLRTVVAVEPERVVYALDAPVTSYGGAATESGRSLSPEYLAGYRDAVLALTSGVGAADRVSAAVPEALAWDETQTTWGLQATGGTSSCRTGKGIRVAVLDTGIDLRHPDFTNRQITTASFIQGEQVDDGHGHGTHCIGTACGPQRPSTLPRYGIADEAHIFAGKVLSNRGSGSDRGILNGIAWAVQNNCRVVSMSLGAPTSPGQAYSTVFEIVARRAMAAGALIVAAAGNESRRSAGIIEPVGHPANCPSILAVAAVDDQMSVADFSTQGLNPDGGQIDIAGPGVRVRSSWPSPTNYRTFSGTSMATPHVAGIAALHAEANPAGDPGELWATLGRSAKRLATALSSDVGAGLVQAPR